MKCLIFVFGLVMSITAKSESLASIYNGQRFQLNDQILVQDADNPDNFYYLPKKYHIRRQQNYDEKTGQIVEKWDVSHRILTKDGAQYSDYTFHLDLEEPGSMELLNATMKLRRAVGGNARIKGRAPVCGMNLGFTEMATAGQPVDPAKFDPNATFIQYSINSSPAGGCNSILDATDFILEYRVPMSLEPGVARNLTSDIGVVLPAVDLILPYKYKDRVVVTVDARSAIDQLKASVGLQGSYASVSAGVQASVEKMMNVLQISGQLQVDCQNPDHTVCDGYVQQAEAILSKTFFTYLPLATSGDTNPLVVADKNHAVSTNLVQVQLAFDQQSAERIGKFRVDFSNTVYDSVNTQTQISAANVPVSLLDPILQSKLSAGL